MYYESGEWTMMWTSDRRVCSARYFPRYLALQTSAGEMSENEFDSFLYVSGDANNFLMNTEDE